MWAGPSRFLSAAMQDRIINLMCAYLLALPFMLSCMPIGAQRVIVVNHLSVRLRLEQANMHTLG